MEHKKTKRIGLLLGVGIFAMPYLFCWLTLRDGYSTRARLASFMWMLFLLLFVLSGAAHANASGGMVVFLVAAFVIYKITPMLLRFFRHLLSPIAETSAAKNVMNAGSAFDMHVRNSVAAAGFDGSRVFDAPKRCATKRLMSWINHQSRCTPKTRPTQAKKPKHVNFALKRSRPTPSGASIASLTFSFLHSLSQTRITRVFFRL